MATTLEELRAESPALVAEAESAASASAVQAERSRLQEIDAVAGLFSAEMVNEAKYGENACSAQELAYRAAQAAVANGQQFLNNMAVDAQASGAAAVPAAPAPEEDPAPEANTPEEKMAAARAAIKELLKKEEK